MVYKGIGSRLHVYHLVIQSREAVGHLIQVGPLVWADDRNEDWCQLQDDKGEGRSGHWIVVRLQTIFILTTHINPQWWRIGVWPVTVISCNINAWQDKYIAHPRCYRFVSAALHG